MSNNGSKDTNNDNNNNNNNVCVFDNSNERNSKAITRDTINVATKIVLCVFFALLSSFLLAIMFVIVGNVQSHYVSAMMSLAMIFDSITNILCALLQWKFSDQLYNKICKQCDLGCKHYCMEQYFVGIPSIKIQIKQTSMQDE